MPTWNIDPSGIQSVLESVNGHNEKLGKALDEENFTDIVDGIDWGAPITSAVPAALGNLFEDQKKNLETITYSVNAGTLGVFNATMAYNEGHTDMASTYQSKMIETAENGKFTWWEKHGYQA